MKSIVKKVSAALMVVPALVLGLAFAGVVAVPAHAAGGCAEANGLLNALSANCTNPDNRVSNLTGNGGFIPTIINIMLFVIGVICVIMIIFGGIRYATSTGDKTRIDNAKNTILYAVVGLVVAILAYAIVNFVVNNIK